MGAFPFRRRPVEAKAADTPPQAGAQFLVPLGMSGRPVTFQKALDLSEYTDELVSASRDTWRTNLAAPPLVVFVDDEPDYTHPLSQALARPNDHLSQTVIWRLVSDYLSGPDKGGAYLLAVKTIGGELAEVWIKPGSEVRPRRDRSLFISGYEWRDGNKWVPVDEGVEVIHLYFPDADDVWAHRSPLMDVVKSIRTNANASAWLDYLLQNGGAPSAIIAVEGSAEAAAQIQAKVNDEYMGPENVGKIGVVSGSKITSVDLGSKLSDVDLGPLKDRIELAVARAYGIPAELLQLYVTAGKGEGLQGNSYREKRKILYANKLTPIHHMIEEAVGMKLCPLYGLPVSALRFDYSQVDVFDDTPLEKAQKAQTVISAVSNISTIAERRRIAAAHGIDLDDDMNLPPGSDDIPELVSRARLSALSTFTLADDSPKQVKSLPRETKLIEMDTKATSLEGAWKARASALFAAEREAARDAIGKLDALTESSLIAAAVSGVKAQAWKAAFAPAIEEALTEAARESVATLTGKAAGRREHKNHPDAVEAVARRVDKLAGNVTATTEDAIRAYVKGGIDEGMTLDEVASGITSQVGPIGTMTAAKRAATIARTETIGALNEGDFLGAAVVNAEMPVVKEWLSAGDDHVRDTHLIDGEQVALDETFSNDLMYPGDPTGGPDEVVNCRCVVLYEPA